MPLILYEYPVEEAAFETALILGRDLPSTRGGQPCLYFWKEMLHLDKTVDINGNHHDIDSQFLDQVVTDYQQAKAKGHEPFLPLGKHADKPGSAEVRKECNTGFLKDVQRRGDSLYGLHQFVGPVEESRKLAACQKSSVGIFKNVQGSDGVVYKTFLDHNAIIPDPQLSDLGGFIPVELTDSEPALAASRGQPIEAVHLQYDREQGASPMPMQVMTPAHVMKIKGLVVARKGNVAGEAITESNALDVLLENTEELATAPAPAILLSREQLTKAQTVLAKADLKDTEASAALLTALEAEKAANLQLSRDLETAKEAKKQADLLLSRDNKLPGADTLHERGLRVDMSLQGLLNAGYSTALVAELSPILAGTPKTRDALMLSRASDEAPDIRAIQIVSALMKHPPAPALGSKNLLLNRNIQQQEEPTDLPADQNAGLLVAAQYNKLAVAGA